jgi:hypothetical protein
MVVQALGDVNKYWQCWRGGAPFYDIAAGAFDECARILTPHADLVND